MEVAGKLDDQNAVGDDDADHHYQSHQGHDVQGGSGSEEEQKHPAEAWGYRQKNNEGILPGSELRHENEVYEHDGENQADPEALKGRAHALNRAPQVDANTFR